MFIQWRKKYESSMNDQWRNKHKMNMIFLFKYKKFLIEVNLLKRNKKSNVDQNNFLLGTKNFQMLKWNLKVFLIQIDIRKL